MKFNIFKGLLACGVLLSMSACDVNTWNEDSLDGFKKPDLNGGGSSQVIQYTLTASDYSSIAKNSDNIALASETGQLDALTAVGSRGYFNEAIQPAEYVPAWLNSVQSDNKYPFYMLNNKATVQLYYKVAENQPAELLKIESAPKYEVTEADYQAAYGSEENYAMSFAPSYAPAKFIPGFLAAAYPNAQANDFVYVGYNYSAQDPVFGGSTGGEVPDEPEPDINSLTMGDNYELHGQLMAICNQGAVLTTSTGTILLYNPSFGWKNLAVGSKATATGEANNYFGALQLKNAQAEVTGTAELNYPAPTKWTGADVDVHLALLTQANKDSKPLGPIYVEVTATLEINSKGYYNFNVEGTSNQVAFYQATDAQKSAVADGQTYTITGFAVNTGKTYVNIIPTAINGVALAPALQSKAVTNVASQATYEVYKYNGTKWAPAANVVVVQQSDYAAMGVNDLNVKTAAANLPKFLAGKFPYATAGTQKYVVYKYYDSASTTTIGQHCDRMTFDGTTWVMDSQDTKMTQFVKSNGKWVYDPTIYLNFPADYKNEASLAFYTACVMWVWNNVNLKVEGITDQTLADWPQTNKVTAFGWCWGSNKPTQEGYGGASAYYCNYDNTQFKKYLNEDFYQQQYGAYKTEEILALSQKRFCEEVAKGAMETLYPDAMPGTSVDQYYQITLVQYSPKQNVDIRYLVTEKGKFKFVDCPVWGLKAE